MSIDLRSVRFIALLLGIAAISWAGPISSCDPNQSGLFTCNLYETNSDGAFTENPPRVLIGNTVGLGFVVFLEPGIDPTIAANQANSSNWSDVVDFTLSEDHFYVQLFSDPFPTEFVNFVTRSGAAFLSESPEDPTVFIGGSGNTYNIFSQSAVDTDTPEPGTTALLLAGAALLAGLGYVRRWTA